MFMNPLSIEGKVVSKKSTPLVNNVPSNLAGTRFEDIQNPYVNNPRQQTGWDRFLNWLGFRSGFDKSQEQYQLASDEYNAQLSQLASEEAYNTPLQQAQRMRQAGLNPDLTGLSGESASEFDNQQESPDVGVSTDVNPFDVLSGIGNTFMSAISGTMALMKDFTSLKQMKTAIDSSDLDLGNKMLGFLTASDSLYHSYSDSDDGSVLGKFDDFARLFFRSSRNVKRFSELRNKASDTLMDLTNQYKSYDEFYKSAESFGKTAGQPYMSGIFPGVSMWSVASSMRPLQEAIYDMNMAQMEAIKKASKYESKVSDKKIEDNTFNDEAAALKSGFEAQSSENEVRKVVAPLKIDETKIYSKMLKRLNAMAEDGDMFAGLLGMLIGSKTLGAPTFGPVTSAYNAVKGVLDKIQ